MKNLQSAKLKCPLKVTNLLFLYSTDSIAIITLPIKFEIILNIFLLTIAFYLFYDKNHNDIYWAETITIASLINTWIEFESVNKIKFDLIQHTIFLQSENILKTVFADSLKFGFEEIEYFTHRQKRKWLSLERQLIFIKIKNREFEILLTDISSNTETADNLVKWLNEIIKND